MFFFVAWLRRLLWALMMVLYFRIRVDGLVVGVLVGVEGIVEVCIFVAECFV